MDKIIIHHKIESLRRCIDRIRDKKPTSIAVLKNDLDIQDIIVVNLERAVQISVDISMSLLAEESSPIPNTMAEGFDALSKCGIISSPIAERMRKSVGFRNIAVHAYQSISWDIVWKIITIHLDDFRGYVQEILTHIDKN